MKKESLNEYFECQILIAEIFYNTNYRSINDSVIEDAIIYYDSFLSDKKTQRNFKPDFMHARAHYYKGVSERSKGLIAEACSDYIKALAIMEDIIDTRKETEEHILFTGLTYNRIGWLLYENGDWEPAISSFKNANDHFDRIDNHTGLMLNYEVMGDISFELKDYEAMLDYYDKADSISNLVEDKDEYVQYFLVQNKVAHLYMEGKRNQIQKLLIDSYKKHEPEQEQYAGLLGRFYYQEQQYDSALFYYAQYHPAIFVHKVTRCSRLVEICQALGDTTKAFHYAQQLSEITKNIPANINIQAKINEQYQNYETSKAHDKHHAIDIKVLVFLCSLIMLLVILFILHINAKKRREKELENKLKQESDNFQNVIDEKNAETESKDKLIEELQKKIDMTAEKQEMAKITYEERMTLLHQNDTCRKLLDKVNSEYIKSGQNYPKLTLSDTQKAVIFKSVDTAFPGFSMKIIKQYPRLTTSDVFYCCLYIIGLNEKQAAAITGKTYQAVWARSAKMNEIFGSDANLKIILKDFLSQWS